MERSLDPLTNWSTSLTSHVGRETSQMIWVDGVQMSMDTMMDVLENPEGLAFQSCHREQEEIMMMKTMPDGCISSNSVMDGSVTSSTKPALRSLRKRSGLFDRELTDDFLEQFSSVTDQIESDHNNQSFTVAGGNLDSLSTNQSDLPNLFGDLEAADLFLSFDKIETSGGEVDLTELPNSPFELEGGMDFGEHFTDLTEAILGVDVAALTNTEMQQIVEEPELAVPLPKQIPSTSTPKLVSAATGRRSNKRRRKVDEEAVVEPVPIAVNHDHDDYTLKRKKLKLSSTSTVEDSNNDDGSDSELEDSSVSCSSVSTSRPPEKTKYKQRRVKNNIASRRSRQSRKQKFVDMEDRVTKLEADNEAISEKIKIMESLAKSLKQHLVNRMSGK